MPLPLRCHSFDVDIVCAEEKSQAVSEMKKGRCRWFGLNKLKKFVYGVAFDGKTMHLVSRSIFGGDVVFLQSIDGGASFRYNMNCIGAVGSEVVAVAVDDFSCFCLFSLDNDKVELYKMLKPFGRGDIGNPLLNHGLYYSSSVGFLTMVRDGYREYVYRFVFDDSKKVFQVELVTKYPYSITPKRRFCINEKSFYVYEQSGDVMHVYDFAGKFWSKANLQNAPKLFQFFAGKNREIHLSNSIEGVTTSNEGETVALFYHKWRKEYTLYKLVGSSWEVYLLCTTSIPSRYARSVAFSASGVVYLDSKREDYAIVITESMLSVKDLDVQKMARSWKPFTGTSFKDFLMLSNLDQLTKRQYFGINF